MANSSDRPHVCTVALKEPNILCLAIEDIDATGRVHIDVGDVTEHFGTGVESGTDLGHLYQLPQRLVTPESLFGIRNVNGAGGKSVYRTGPTFRDVVRAGHDENREDG